MILNLLVMLSRFPGQVDPEFEPPKVYMVQRIERMKFNPFWHKKLLKEFGIDRKVC